LLVNNVVKNSSLKAIFKPTNSLIPVKSRLYATILDVTNVIPELEDSRYIKDFM
jgi:hypothetical protein